MSPGSVMLDVPFFSGNATMTLYLNTACNGTGFSFLTLQNNVCASLSPFSYKASWIDPLAVALVIGIIVVPIIVIGGVSLALKRKRGYGRVN